MTNFDRLLDLLGQIDRRLATQWRRSPDDAARIGRELSKIRELTGLVLALRRCGEGAR